MEDVLKVKNWYVKKQDLEAFLEGNRAKEEVNQKKEMLIRAKIERILGYLSELSN